MWFVFTSMLEILIGPMIGFVLETKLPPRTHQVPEVVTIEK